MTAISNIQTCGTCRFSVPAMGQDGKINFTSRVCRRFPPVPMMIPTPQGISMQFVWPQLDTSKNCGEWQGSGVIEMPLPGERKPEAEPAS